jgi:hypothetical protein
VRRVRACPIPGLEIWSVHTVPEQQPLHHSKNRQVCAAVRVRLLNAEEEEKAKFMERCNMSVNSYR